MKQFTLICLGIVLGLATILAANDAVNVWLVRRSSGSSAYKMERLFGRSPFAFGEIPIIGSSRAKGCYMPSEISPHGFNYGEDGSVMSETMYHLRGLLDRPEPGTVIVNLDPWGFAYLFSGYRCDYSLVPARDPKGPVPLSDRITRFVGKLRTDLTEWLNARRAVTKVIDQGAVILKTSRTNAEWEVINRTIIECDFSCTDKARAYLDELLAHQGNKTLVWVVAPISPVWRQHYHGTPALDAFLKKLATRPNTRTFNYLAHHDFDQTDFADPSHLNEKGARKFSRLLKAALNL